MKEKAILKISTQLTCSDEVLVSARRNGVLLVNTPIFGFDNLLGSVVITYKPVTPDFNTVASEKVTKKHE